MFDRLQKPFLTVETGEAYQPIRITYELLQKDAFIKVLEKLKCIEKGSNPNSWNWYWKDECDALHFESLDSFRKNPEHPLRLATITIRDGRLYFSFPSFKRACIAIPFFHKEIQAHVARVHHADFINK